MGFNSTVVIRNDALHDIENDKEFGAKLVAAISCLTLPDDENITISSGMHNSAATIVETHHNSMDAIVAVGGNRGYILGYIHNVYRHDSEEEREEALKQLAHGLGFYIRRKKKKSI